MITCELGQARKGATAASDSCAGVSALGEPPNFPHSFPIFLSLTQQLASLAFSITTEFTRKSLLQIDVAMPLSYDLAVGFFLLHSFL